MKIGTPHKLLLLSIVLSPVVSYCGLIVTSIFAHSSDTMKFIGMCMAPGTFLYVWWPGFLESPHFLKIVIGVEFVIFLTLGFLYLKVRAWLRNS